MTHLFDPAVWSAVPPWFWALVFFMFGCTMGSFLNVCIHRMPLGQSIVSPPSHCPHCQYSIPWYLNIPLVTWVYLRGKCRNCGAPIAVRYFLVELLTGIVFFACWMTQRTFPMAIIYGVFLSGLIVATFIDFEHLIIPDEITMGGVVVGFICSFFVPRLHGVDSTIDSMKQSLLGAAIGALVIYLIVRGGKLVFGRHRLKLSEESRVVFTETALELPDQSVLYEDIFYRQSDTIVLKARTVELVDRCYQDVPVRLSPDRLRIGEEEFKPENVPHLEAMTSEVILPREAMGLGDVKFMAAIGAFLGWHAVVFSLVVSSLVGAVVGTTLVLMRRRELSSRLPYGPYIAAAAALWIFAGPNLVAWYKHIIFPGVAR